MYRFCLLGSQNGLLWTESILFWLSSFSGGLVSSLYLTRHSHSASRGPLPSPASLCLPLPTLQECQDHRPASPLFPAVRLLFHLASCPTALRFLWCSASVDIRAFALTVPSSQNPLSWSQGKSELLRMMAIIASLCLKECFSSTAPYQFPVYSLPRNHQISQCCIYLFIFFLVHWKVSLTRAGILPTLFTIGLEYDQHVTGVSWLFVQRILTWEVRKFA